MCTATVTVRLSILFLSIIQKRVEVLVCSIRRRQFRRFQICLHHFYAISRFVLWPKPCMYTWKPKMGGETRSVYQPRKLKDFQICTHFCCVIIGVSYTENPMYTLKNSKRAERVVVLTIRRRKIRGFEICIHFYYAIMGVWFTELTLKHFSEYHCQKEWRQTMVK